MKKRLVVLSLLLGSFGMNSLSFAADTKYEIFVNNLASVNFGFASATTTSVNFLNGPVNVTGGYYFMDNLAVTLNPMFGSLSVGTSSAYSWGASVGLLYNATSDMTDSPYLQAQIGYGGTSTTASGATTATTTSGLLWGVGAGKRFKIGDHVTYAPNVTYMNSASSGVTLGNLAICPLQFTVLM